ncbi:hypothetical protein AB2762_13185 [Acinetobacter indicus]
MNDSQPVIAVKNNNLGAGGMTVLNAVIVFFLAPLLRKIKSCSNKKAQVAMLGLFYESRV